MAREKTKQPFDIDDAMRRSREAVEPYPKAALFELAAEGYTSPFEILVACMISIRTCDEVDAARGRACSRSPARRPTVGRRCRWRRSTG